MMTSLYGVNQRLQDIDRRKNKTSYRDTYIMNTTKVKASTYTLTLLLLAVTLPI